MRETIDIGIDLGTTNSGIAVFREDGVLLFKDGPSDTVPSVVRIDKRGNVYVGAAAYDKLHLDSHNTHAEFKRLMGTTKTQTFEKAGREMLPEELSAEVLKRLRAIAAERGEPVEAAVVTVPAMFEIPACAATKKAGELAGLSFVTLLPEPIAAAYAYGFRGDVNGLLFVYDLGGGTFDASILRAEDGRLTVVDHDGNNHLGGKNFDWAIVEEIFVPALRDRFDLPELNRGGRYPTLFARLKKIAEQAKIDLSRMDAVAIYEEDLGEDAKGRSVDLDLELTRSQFASLIAPSIDETLATCGRLLERNRIQPGDVERVLLVGGPTRIPFLRERLRELGIPLDLEVDPMTVVARGAAIFARSQRLPEHLRIRERRDGHVFVSLEYVPMSETEEPLVGGKFDPGGNKALPKGCTVEITHTDGHWESGRIPVRDTGTFVCTLHLNRCEANDFRIKLRDKKDQLLAIEPDTFTITHGMRTDDAPMRSSVRIGLANGLTQVVIAKGTPLPATSREIQLRTVRPIRPGADDRIEIPILEGEEDKANRNRGGGKLVLSADRISRELPTGSTLDFTMTIDESGVPEKVSVYSAYLDEWFEDFERASTEFAGADELQRQLEFETERLDTVRQKAQDAGARAAEDKAAALASGRALRDISRQIQALRGGDEDAAGVCRNALIEIGKQIDAIEDELEWPDAMRRYEEQRAQCRRLVHEYGKRMHEEQLARLEDEADECIRNEDATGLQQRTAAMAGLSFNLLSEQPGFWHARFEWLAEKTLVYKDPTRANQLINEGRQARGRDDLYSLKSICDNLVALLPDDVSGPPNLFRSDVEL